MLTVDNNLCNQPCNTCIVISCPWKSENVFDWDVAEKRADQELKAGKYREFGSVEELITDLLSD